MISPEQQRLKGRMMLFSNNGNEGWTFLMTSVGISGLCRYMLSFLTSYLLIYSCLSILPLPQSHDRVDKNEKVSFPSCGERESNRWVMCQAFVNRDSCRGHMSSPHVGLPHKGASQVVLVVKNPAANAGDTGGVGPIPGSGRSPGVGNGNPLQYSCLGNSKDREAGWARVHGIAKELDTTGHMCTHTCWPGPG